LVDGWRAVYAASMDEVRKHPERVTDPGYAASQSLENWSRSFRSRTDRRDLHHLTMGWHAACWPTALPSDAAEDEYIISPLSNGNVALLTNMRNSQAAVGPVMSAELFEHYKPDPRPISAPRACFVCRRAGDDGAAQ